MTLMFPSRRFIFALAPLILVLPLVANFLRGGPAPWETDSATCIAPLVQSPQDGAYAGNLPFKPMAAWEQYLAVICGFGVKAVYMSLTIAVLLYLRKETAPDLRALQASLLFFFAGEAFCAINYFGFHERSYLFEYLHSTGMVFAFAAALYFLMEFLDLRILHFSEREQRCAMTGLCRGCTKSQPDHSCALRRLLQLGLPMLAILAAIPLTSAFRTDAYVTDILGTRYIYQHPLPHQFYEIRDLPLLAILLFAAAWLRLRSELHPMPQTRLLAAAGLGALAFAWFRWTLLSAFAANQLWFVAWEELTELLFVLAVVGFLCVFPLGSRRDEIVLPGTASGQG